MKRNSKNVKLRIKNTPLDIKIFYIFSFLITVISIVINLESNRELYEKIIPYTGWNPGMGYESLTFFISLWILTFKETYLKMINVFIRGGIILVMVNELYSGIRDRISISPEDYISTNPYLRYDSLTPIYTIVLPLFWILVMMGTLIISYFKNKNQGIIQES